MNVKNIIIKLKTFWKEHKLFLSLYLFVFIIICLGVNYILSDEVERSKRRINERIDLFSGDGSCYSEDNSYTIVGYKLTEKPDIAETDSSLYEQMYGSFDNYYIATSKPWNFVLYKKESGGVLWAYSINPLAVGLNNGDPGKAFESLYNRIKSSYKVKFENFSPLEIKSDFHYLVPHYESGFEEEFWYDESLGKKLFFTEKSRAYYLVEEDGEKVLMYLCLGIGLLFLIETIVFSLFLFFKKKLRKPCLSFLCNLKNRNFNKTPTKNNEITDLEYELLLRKIHPQNFMNPYDEEKVRIANDLYSALLKSKGNQTIIQLIEEKAKNSLKI